MIPLSPKELPITLQEILDELQAKIDSMPTFAQKQAKCQSLWNSKGGENGRKAFETIIAELYSLCVYIGACNYCEHNEGNDVEHIYPKSFFPEHTFNWENYLLACKQCNSAFKLDKCYTLNNSDDLEFVNRGTEPPNKSIAFINPRTENPNDFMVLNLLTYKFDFLPSLTKRETNKASATLQILELNTRSILIEARRSASRHYYAELERLSKILDAETIADLEAQISPFDDRFDLTQPLPAIKETIKESYKKYIGTYLHPSVWHSIKLIESKINPKWQRLFTKLPEALHW